MGPKLATIDVLELINFSVDRFESCAYYISFSRKPCFGEFQEILQQIAHLKPSRENLTKLVNGLYHCCKFSHIDIYSFSVRIQRKFFSFQKKSFKVS